MSDADNSLFAQFGSHEKVAEILGYTPRHYRKIRRKIKRGEGFPSRIEVLLLAQGYSKKLIHERLTEKKHISMAYVTFCQIMQKEIQTGAFAALKDQKPANTAEASTQKTLPSCAPRIVNAAKEPFPDPRKMRLVDGI